MFALASQAFDKPVIEGIAHGGPVFSVVEASRVVRGKDAGDGISEAVVLRGPK